MSTPIHFRYLRKQKVFQNKLFIDLIIVLLITLNLFVLFDLNFHEGNKWVFGINSILFFLIYAVAALIALLIFFSDRKVVTDFIVTDTGILAGEILYKWKNMRHYHWLGEAQEERIGVLGVTKLLRYDPMNLYRLAGIWVARVRLDKPWYSRCYLNLEVAPEKCKALQNVLEEHEVKRLSAWRMAILGINIFPLILLIVFPLIMLAILLLIY